MDFREAEQRFSTLDARYRAGEIDPAQYHAQLYQLQVRDGAGRLWMMQESTGRWHVFDGAHWQAGTPPGEAAAAPSRRPWLIVGGLSLALVACAGLVLAGVLLGPRLLPGLFDFPQGITAPPGEPAGAAVVEGPLPPLEWTAEEALPVAADGTPMRHESGAALQVPPAAVPGGGAAELQIHAPQGALFDALQRSYVFETGFYAAAAQGTDDGVGRATLHLPAAGPDSRILAVIDGRNLVLLDVEPQGGVLTLNPRLGPAEVGEGVVDGLGRGGTIRYAVVHPRQNAGGRRASPGFAALVGQAADPRQCAPRGDTGALGVRGVGRQPDVVRGCRKNAAGSVFVSYPPNAEIAESVVDGVVDAAEAGMAAYRNHGGDGQGFAAAVIGPSRPLHIELTASGGPYYTPANGVVHVPLDVATQIGGAGANTLHHEIAHWVQDEAYVMTWAFLWGEKKWWLETAAENMVMLINPAYTAQNLTTYGTISLEDSRLDFQGAPYDWRGNSYIQAQLVKLNMCDDSGVCPLSETSFKAAIDAGTYPFEDDGARQKLSANLDDYARYLLGATPERANVGILGGEPVRTGSAYGEQIQVARSRRAGDFWRMGTGSPPQMTEEADGAFEVTVIDARLDKDGVYPLQVESGMDGGRNAGLPAALRVAPGTPLYYRAGDGPVTFHDGSEELVLQPIHATMGFPAVRVVALGREGGERFQARVEVIDLSGVWVLRGVPVSSDVTCSDETDNEDLTLSFNAEQAGNFGMGLISLSTVWGDFVADGSGTRWTWTVASGRFQGDVAYGKPVYEADVELTPEAIRLEGAAMFDMFGGEQGRPDGPARAAGPWAPLTVLTPLAVAAGWARTRGRRGIRRLLLAAAGIGVGALLLTGCLGFNLSGTSAGEVTFKTLTFEGGTGTPTLTLGLETLVGMGASADTEPLWILSDGQGTFQVDFTAEASSSDFEGNESRAARRCTGQVVYDMEAALFKDAVLVLAE